MCNCGFHNSLDTNVIKADSINGQDLEDWFNFLYKSDPDFAQIVDWNKTHYNALEFRKIAVMYAIAKSLNYKLEFE